MSYADLWASMGLFAKGIVVVMFVMSAWSWAVSISKQLYLRKSQKETRKFAPEFSRYLQEEQLDGATALFVGLLGTTMGIVTAFQGMSASGGSGSLAAITGGVAEALITTAFGLLVAIPAVWLYNYFATKIDFLTVEMTYTSKELIDYLIKSVGSEFGRSIFTKEFQTQKTSQTSGPIKG